MVITFAITVVLSEDQNGVLSDNTQCLRIIINLNFQVIIF